MSISEELESAVADGRLIRFELEFDSDERKRSILLHPRVWSEIYGNHPDFRERFGRLRADLEMFVRGQHIRMSMTPYQHKKAYMGLLAPPEEGVFEIRSRDPKPGLRLLGKFPCTDVFVALEWAPRSVKWKDRPPLGDGKSLEYQMAIIETHQRWANSLPNLSPVTGENIHDYISENVSPEGD